MVGWLKHATQHGRFVKTCQYSMHCDKFNCYPWLALSKKYTMSKNSFHNQSHCGPLWCRYLISNFTLKNVCMGNKKRNLLFIWVENLFCHRMCLCARFLWSECGAKIHSTLLTYVYSRSWVDGAGNGYLVHILKL